MKLAEQLREFPEQNLQYVVDFICEICPAAFQEIEDDKVQIIVSNMDVITFRQVMEYS